MENNSTTLAMKPVYHLLKITFGIVPIVAGLDKFTDLLVNWEGYLHPGMAGSLPFSPHGFMMVVGVIEILAGILVLVKTNFGAYLVSAWLTLIALTLIAGGHFYDVAVRDLVMAVSAFSLGRMSKILA